MAPLHTSHCTNSKHHIWSTPTEAPLIPPFCVRMGGGEGVVKGREDRRRKKEGGTKRVEGGAPNAELGSKGEGDFLFAVILYSTTRLWQWQWLSLWLWLCGSVAGRQALSPCSAVRNCLIPCLDASLFLNKAIGHWLLTKAWLSKPKPNNNRYISGYKLQTVA